MNELENKMIMKKINILVPRDRKYMYAIQEFEEDISIGTIFLFVVLHSLVNNLPKAMIKLMPKIIIKETLN